MSTTQLPIPFPILVQDFFRKRLIAERNASTHTIHSYRDTFCLLLRYLEKRTGKSPANLSLQDVDASAILAFLDHLEQQRGNSPRSRNTRLAAICSFMHYICFRDPSSLTIARQVLAIPRKHFEQPVLTFLTREEVDAILDACDTATWSGSRDHVMFKTFYNTGARVSEIIALTRADLDLGHGPSILLRGKGRKQRAVPLWKNTARELTTWLRRDTRAGTSDQAPLFPNRDGDALSRSGVEYRLRIHVKEAAQKHPSLLQKHVSPHCLRHTTALHLLQSGVDMAVIALWLGHESLETTHAYVEADMAMKERALSTLQEPHDSERRYRPSPSLLSFLERL